MKPDIIIRADGGTRIGMGHVVRCLALADMLADEFNITFAVQAPDDSTLNTIKKSVPAVITLPAAKDYETDCTIFTGHLSPGIIVVLDGYHFNTSYQRKVKEKGCKLVYIDDLHSWHQAADIILNQAEGIKPSSYDAEEYTRFCLGARYALLRKPFLHSSPSRNITGVKKVFISMGAADENNITEKFTKALLQLEDIEEIHLMLGAVNPHIDRIEGLKAQSNGKQISTHVNISAEDLSFLLRECDVAVCPASTITLEACASGIGLLSGYTADNQKSILSGLKDRGVLTDMGDLNQIDAGSIKAHLIKLAGHPALIQKMAANQKLLIDGKSPDRLKKVFKDLYAEKLWFRLADKNDALLYFKWASDPAVRSNSYSQEELKLEDHLKWFNSRVNSPDYFFYLFFNYSNQPAGQVRITMGGSENIIGISIDEAFRGQSLALEMISRACTSFFYKYPDKVISAYIKKENTASYRAFKKAGFEEVQLLEVNGCKSFKLDKRFSYE